MELKSVLKDYTAPEFLALVKRIWAVDLPRHDHNRLINHFDRIVGHPKGADLLFHSDDESISNSPELVVYQVTEWHRKQGVEAFKANTVTVPNPPIAMSLLARSLAEVQRLAADLSVSQQASETMLIEFEKSIRQMQSLQTVQVDIQGQEANIRTLEQSRLETSKVVRKFESWKISLESAKTRAESNLKFAWTEQAQWQNIVQSINATHQRYFAQLAIIKTRYETLHDESEVQLKAALELLINARRLAKAGPAYSAYSMNSSLHFFDKRPNVLLEDDSSALLVQQRLDLQKAIRAAVAEFAWRHTSGEASVENQGVAVLSFAFISRAVAQVYAVSVPLIEFLPLEGRDWQSLAASRSEVEIPFRLATTTLPAKTEAAFKWRREGKDLQQIFLYACRPNHPISRVRVRAAQYDAQRNVLSFYADGENPVTVHWSEATILENRVPETPSPSTRMGLAHSSPVPIIEPVSTEKESVQPDDYIVVFPADSGYEPLYVMFRSRPE